MGEAKKVITEVYERITADCVRYARRPNLFAVGSFCNGYSKCAISFFAECLQTTDMYQRWGAMLNQMGY